MRPRTFLRLFAAMMLSLLGCDSDHPSDAGRADAGGTDAGGAIADSGAADPCAHDAPTEADLVYDGPTGTFPTPVFAGPGAGPDGSITATPPAEGWVVASTYLRIDPTNVAEFQEMAGAVVQDLFTRPGLVAMSTARSPSCGTARTLTIWESQEDMLAFVSGEAHMAAMMEIDSLSRGGSATTHWSAASVEAASWDEAFTRIAADEGPFY
ncbi:MAG: antibiotic biosynthesis monooxygenase [Sandaracinaceae bacterium]